MSKLLATGANGAVGSYVEQVFGSKYELVLVDRDELDVTERLDCKWIRDLNPDVVLHLAAATDVDACELDKDMAWRVNADGTKNVALNSPNSKLVYVSTAGVFGGDQEDPYVESDWARPANTYGWTKLRGEKMVDMYHDDHLIVRSGWMFGGGNGLDKKFVGKIRAQIEAGQQEILAVNDKFGSPTYALDLLHVIALLLDSGQSGLFHGSNDGVASRYDVAREIVTVLGADVNVVPVGSDQFPLPAPRARSEAMTSERREPSRSWRDALAEYLG
jgi:dTDP-4-dehydrorhamnose reductase